MVIKVKRGRDKNNRIIYKSTKKILTPKDIQKADRFDSNLEKMLKKLEGSLLKSGILSYSGKKKNALKVWYKIGKSINKFLKIHSIDNKDISYFWHSFYGRSKLIHKSSLSIKSGLSRNDFKTASVLSNYRWETVKKVGPWAMWREIISYKCVEKDSRILKWIIKQLINKPRTRDEARPLLKAIARRFKRMDTSILSKRELFQKFNEIED